MNGETPTDPNNIAESFNQFFSEIGENLDKNFPNDYSEFRNYLKDPVTHSMFLFHTSESEIMKIIKSLKNTNSTGYDNFLPRSSNFLPPYWHLH